MKVLRYFIQHESDETGMTGFVPLWIPKAAGFDPSMARGMVHDMLEHRLCDQGHYHEEVVAFGRIIALRGLNNVHLGAGLAYTAPQSNGLELAGIFHNAMRNADYSCDLHQAPGTAPADSHFESYAAELLKHYRSTYIAEAVSDDAEEEHAEATVDTAHMESMLGWLRIGYRDAIRRYGQPDHGSYDVANAAWGWADKHTRRLDRLGEEAFGCVLRLRFDTTRLTMQEDLIEPNREYGMHAEWLRRRIWDWKNTHVRAPGV